jgi:serine/threonine protein kinase
MDAEARPEISPDGSRIVAGKYRLLSVLGKGGMGTVWRAEHLQLGAKVAVKLIDATVTGSDGLRQCQKEASAAAALRSPHVVQVLDFGSDDETGHPFIVMELLEGESLAERLARRGRLSLAETARVLTHVARALSRAHEAGIIHRDLKPENVFLVRNDEEELAKVLDFGTARVQRTGALAGSTTTGGVVGTPYYMSPEHISAQPVDHHTDLWAMGVMGFECVTGRRPFDADQVGQLVLQICTYPIPAPSQLAPVPAAFDAWFARATRRALDQRFPSARALAHELRRIALETAPPEVIADGEPPPPVTFRLPPATERPSPPPRRRRVGWWVGGALLAAALGVVALRSGLAGRARTSEPPAATAPPPAAAPAGPPPPALPEAPAVVGAAAAKPARRPVRRKAPARAATAGVPAPEGAAPDVESVLDHRR